MLYHQLNGGEHSHQSVMQESITLEAAATPGALFLPDLTSLDLCL